jgi:hypothetical protein
VELNSAFSGEFIRSVEPVIIDRIQEYFYSELTKRYLLNLSKEIDIIYQKRGGIGQVSMRIKEEIAQSIIHDDDQPMGFKYTLKHKEQIILKILKKYGG